MSNGRIEITEDGDVIRIAFYPEGVEGGSLVISKEKFETLFSITTLAAKLAGVRLTVV